MSRNTLIYLFSFFMFTMVACNAQQPSNDPAEVMLVDVRTPAEFAEGSVPDAVNIPLDRIEDRISEFDKDKEIIVFCRSGNRSAQALSILKDHGFTNVRNGGTWQQVDQAIKSNKNHK